VDTVPQSQETMALSGKPLTELVSHDLRFHRLVHPAHALRHELVPLQHSGLALLEKAAIPLRLEQGQQRLQRPAAVADEPDFHGKPEPDTHGIDVELHSVRAARLGIELDVREGCPDEEQGVAAFHRVVRGLRAQKADPTRCVGAVVGHASFAEQRLDDGAARSSASCSSSAVAPSAPRPARITTFFPALSTSAARCRSFLGRHSTPESSDGRGMLRDVALAALRHGLRLEIDGEN
jgi:hypothetical protein